MQKEFNRSYFLKASRLFDKEVVAKEYKSKIRRVVNWRLEQLKKENVFLKKKKYFSFSFKKKSERLQMESSQNINHESNVQKQGKSGSF